MKNTFRIYGIGFLLVIGILSMLSINKTPLINWSKNFDIKNKSPFGLFVFYNEATDLFNNKLQKVKATPYNYYKENIDKEPHNILIFQSFMEHESWIKILENVERGSDLMLINEYFQSTVLDTLNIRMTYNYSRYNLFKLTDIKFEKDSLIIEKQPSRNYFEDFPEAYKALGLLVDEPSIPDQLNFISIKHGKGNIYLHSEPLIITNYYLLKPENQKYIEGVFSYLPDRETLWFLEEEPITASRSIMRFILSKPGLRHAWWLFLGGLLLYLLFNSKRKQRMIPIIQPLANKSVEFVKSISNLYLQEGDFRDIITKKIHYFLYHIRTEFLIDTKTLDENFIQLLHLKTGESLDTIKQACLLIKKVQDPSSYLKREEMIQLNKLLNQIIK